MACTYGNHRWIDYGSYVIKGRAKPVARQRCSVCGVTRSEPRGALACLKKGGRMIDPASVWDGSLFSGFFWHLRMEVLKAGVAQGVKAATTACAVDRSTAWRWIHGLLSRKRVPTAMALPAADVHVGYTVEALRDYLRSRRRARARRLVSPPPARRSKRSPTPIDARWQSDTRPPLEVEPELRRESATIWRLLVRSRTIASLVIGCKLPCWASRYRGYNVARPRLDRLLMSEWDWDDRTILDRDYANEYLITMGYRASWIENSVWEVIGTRYGTPGEKRDAVAALAPLDEFRLLWEAHARECYVPPIGESWSDAFLRLGFTAAQAKQLEHLWREEKECLEREGLGPSSFYWDDGLERDMLYELRWRGRRMIVTAWGRGRLAGRAFGITRTAVRRGRHVLLSLGHLREQEDGITLDLVWAENGRQQTRRLLLNDPPGAYIAKSPVCMRVVDDGIDDD